MRGYLEDLEVGRTVEVGQVTVTAEEIVAFARQFDPQPFHTDEAAARGSPFGGLIASGWHTASLCMRLVVERLIDPVTTLGSPGVDELRWLRPVRPGDTLTLHVTVLEATPSRSKPDRGIGRFRYELSNQRGESVMTMVALGMIRRRPVS